jgi:DNA-binding transcriptional LysR family regulator
VVVTLVEGYPESLIERMQNDQIDVSFIRRLSPNVEGIDMALLHEESMVVALPSGHKLARSHDGRGAALSLKGLAGETFILFGDPNGDALQRNSAFAAACHAAGFTPHVGQVVPHISSRLNLIAAGLGIAVVAASLQHIKIEGLAFRRLKDAAQLKAPLSLASRRGDPSPVVRQFLRLAKRTAKTLK